MNKELRAGLLLLLTAAIWGFAMAAQRDGAQFVPPFTFNGVRYVLGTLALLPLTIRENKGTKNLFTKDNVKKGVLVGLVLFTAAILQQFGLIGADAGKAGFLTALYVVLVPVLGILFKRKTRLTTWLALAMTLPALYLLCVKPGQKFVLEGADALLLIGAVFWALHILVTDRYVAGMSALKLCTIQFFVTAVLNLICALFTETVTLANLWRGAWAIAYCGLFSTAVAYTLQTIGQKDCRPAYAAVILSLESVFSAISGALLLGERMTTQGYIGCVIMFLAVLLAQMGALLPARKEKTHV